MIPATLPVTPVLPPDISSLLWAALFILVPPLVAAIVVLHRQNEKRRDGHEKQLQADLDEEEALRVAQLKIIESHTASLVAHTNAIHGLTVEIKLLTGEISKRRTR